MTWLTRATTGFPTAGRRGGHPISCLQFGQHLVESPCGTTNHGVAGRWLATAPKAESQGTSHDPNGSAFARRRESRAGVAPLELACDVGARPRTGKETMNELVRDDGAPRSRIRMRWLLAAGCVALAAGFLGFRSVTPTDSLLTSVYRAVQLFTFNSGTVDSDVPWLLEVARWVAPACVLTGLYQAIRSAVRRVWNEWCASRRTGHVVILGLGRKGTSIALGVLARDPKAKVTGVDSDPTACAAARGDDRLASMRTLCRDGGSKATLHLAAVTRAAQVVVATESDVLNLRLAELVHELVAARGRRRTQVFVHISDSSFRDELSANDAIRPPVTGGAEFAPRPRWINQHADLARAILRRFPLERFAGCDGARDPTRSVHLILTGLDDLQLALLVEAARVGHYLGGRKVRVHVLANEPAAARQRLLSAYPGIEACVAGLEFARIPASACSGEDVRRVLDGIASPAMCTVAPANDATLEVHRETLRIRKAHAASGERHALRVLAPEPSKKDDWARHLHERIPGAALPSEVGFYDETVVAETMDDGAQSVARTIHEDWYRHQELGAAQDPEARDALRRKTTFRPWAELRPVDQEANHSQASHGVIKVRAAGADLGTETPQSWRARLNDAELLERLARMEHERWMADRLLAGYRYADVRDDARRTHDNLKPFDDLPDRIKESDRNAVRGVGDRLAAMRSESPPSRA